MNEKLPTTGESISPHEVDSFNEEGQDNVLEGEMSFDQVETTLSGFEDNTAECCDDLQREAVELGVADDPEYSSILEKFRRSAGKEFRALALGALTLLPTPSYGVENYEETVDNGLVDLGARVQEDNYETMYSFFGRSMSMQQVASVTGVEGEGEVGATPFDMADATSKVIEIGEREDTPLKNFLGKITGNDISSTVMHNHPLKLFQKHYNLSDEHIRKMYSGESAMLVAPPSLGDIEGMFNTSEKVNRVDYVVGPSGIWECDPDESNPYMQITREHIKKIAVELEQVINQADLSEIDGLAEGSTGEIPIQDIMEDIDQNSEVGDLGSLLSEKIRKFSEERDAELGPDYLQAMENLHKTAEEVRQASIEGRDTESPIAEYISISKSLGIEVTYTPHGEKIAIEDYDASFRDQ